MKNKKDKPPKVHPDLEGFDIKINSNGEIESTHSIEDLNKFLDKNVVDKKLKNRKDLDVIRDETFGQEEDEDDGYEDFNDKKTEEEDTFPEDEEDLK